MFCNRKQLSLIYREKKFHKTHPYCEMLNHAGLEELAGFAGIVPAAAALPLRFNTPQPRTPSGAERSPQSPRSPCAA